MQIADAAFGPPPTFSAMIKAGDFCDSSKDFALAADSTWLRHGASDKC